MIVTVKAFLLIVILWPVCSLGTELLLFKLSSAWRKPWELWSLLHSVLVLWYQRLARNWQRYGLGTFQMVSYGLGLEDMAISKGPHD